MTSSISDAEFESLRDDYQEAVLDRHEHCEMHEWVLEDEFRFQELRMWYEREAKSRGIEVMGG